MKRRLDAVRPLAVTQGDPAGVGPAATLLAWKALHEQPEMAFYVRASANALVNENDRLGLNVPVRLISDPEEAWSAFGSGVPVLNMHEAVKMEAGKPVPESAPNIIRSIEICVDDVWTGKAAAIVTNPISKALLYGAGFRFPGHTEFLAHLAGVHSGQSPDLPVMMLVGGGLRVALVTIHVPLAQVPDLLTTQAIAKTGQIVIDSLRQDFGLPEPRLGVCGLNPHAGENGTIGREDVEIIGPAIKQMNQSAKLAFGPRPGDTIFHEMLGGQYDAVLAMYHDQGLIPVKTLDIWGGVNATLGLPFVRTSPDHGTGYDAAAAGKINASSLIAALRLARDMANRRNADQGATP